LGRAEPTSEGINRDELEGQPPVWFRHFSASWVLRTLVQCSVAVNHPTVTKAIGWVWAAFDDDHSLWKWSNGDLPIWMTFDGIAALRIAALGSLPAGRDPAGANWEQRAARGQ
jgi:hypothetical protein